MRKILSFLAILFLGVLCTACVNTLAVSELNQLAQEYLENGETDKAITRLEASIDLDDRIYFSRYNLAVAYLGKGQCEKALEQIDVALELSKNEPAAYYTSGVIASCVAENIFIKHNEDGSEEEIIYNDNNELMKKVNEYIGYLNKSIDGYNKYIELIPNADDSQQVLEQINNNKAKIESYKTQYGIK